MMPCSQKSEFTFSNQYPPAKRQKIWGASDEEEEEMGFDPDNYRSSLSSTLPPIEGYPVGKHPLVCRLRQGMYNTNPPQPCY